MQGNPNNPRPSELEWLMALAADAAEIQMRQYGNVGAALVAITPSGLKLLESRKLLDNANKDAFASAMRLCCVATAATVGVLTAEVWMLSAKPGERLDLNVRPSMSPDRREGVFLSGEARGGICLQWWFPILRNSAGTFTGFGPVTSFPPEQSAGRYIGLLPDRIGSEREREAAATALSALGFEVKDLGPA